MIALALSLVGHPILFLEFHSYRSIPLLRSQIPDDLIIRTELKSEPPKKIQMSKSLKKTPKQASQSSQIADDKSQIPGGQGGSFDQQGVAF
ncbi:hypothetical protein [Polynucleobacter necessarius]|uniref:hypothetical protein n=1 Tax=Polynucleobacter necessarius TaxID=576610 RepID=UPI0018D53C38|nr:hypothetical protein [Polynucleobacter necessarius]